MTEKYKTLQNTSTNIFDENLLNNITNQNHPAEYFEENKYMIYLLKNRVSSPKFPSTIKQSFGFKKHEFFIDLKFKTESKYLLQNEFITHYYDLHYGNCFKFNSGFDQNGSAVPLVKQVSAGKNHGIFMVLFADVFKNELSNFLNYDYSYGIKIAINNQTYIPLYKEGFTLSVKTGTCTSIGLKKLISSRLPKPFSPCEDLSSYDSVLYREFLKQNKTYKQDVCYEMCKV